MWCYKEGLSVPNFLLGSELGSQVFQSHFQQLRSKQHSGPLSPVSGSSATMHQCQNISCQGQQNRTPLTETL